LASSFYRYFLTPGGPAPFAGRTVSLPPVFVFPFFFLAEILPLYAVNTSPLTVYQTSFPTLRSSMTVPPYNHCPPFLEVSPGPIPSASLWEFCLTHLSQRSACVRYSFLSFFPLLSFFCEPMNSDFSCLFIPRLGREGP